jgi:hypothetical protein
MSVALLKNYLNFYYRIYNFESISRFVDKHTGFVKLAEFLLQFE